MSSHFPWAHALASIPCPVFGEGTFVCYPKCSYSDKVIPTSVILGEGVGDGQHQRPLGRG